MVIGVIEAPRGTKVLLDSMAINVRSMGMEDMEVVRGEITRTNILMK